MPMPPIPSQEQLRKKFTATLQASACDGDHEVCNEIGDPNSNIEEELNTNHDEFGYSGRWSSPELEIEDNLNSLPVTIGQVFLEENTETIPCPLVTDALNTSMPSQAVTEAESRDGIPNSTNLMVTNSTDQNKRPITA